MQTSWNNDTNNVLIAKRYRLLRTHHLNNFHPIILCSMISKIISKVRANLLKKKLLEDISNTQSGFVSWRLITYNVWLLAHEVTHFLHSKRKGKAGYAKLVMSTAYYDRVEWPLFMHRMLLGCVWMAACTPILHPRMHIFTLLGSGIGCLLFFF